MGLMHHISSGWRGSSRLARFVVVAGLAWPLAGCLGYDGEVQHGYVQDESALAKIKDGMPAEQVLVTLGTPSTTSTVGGDAWYYISQKTVQTLAFTKPEVTDQKVLAVYFSKTKKVERLANYGLEDGKVVDYVTRTTPTAGKESNFIKNMLTNLLRFTG